jgi:hypothetical protein
MVEWETMSSVTAEIERTPEIGADQRPTRVIAAASLANLKPPFKVGHSGNPRGRPSAGLVVSEWYNQIAHWSLPEIQAIIDDPEAPAAQKLAAVEWMEAASNNRDASGRLTMSAHADRIHDRTVGKPNQQIGVNTTQVSTDSSALCLDRAALDRLTPQQITVVAQILDLLKRAIAGDTIELPSTTTTLTAEPPLLPTQQPTAQLTQSTPIQPTHTTTNRPQCEHGPTTPHIQSKTHTNHG